MDNLINHIHISAVMEDSVQIIARSGDFDNTPCQHCNLSKMEYVKVQINGTVDYKLQCINPTCKSFLGFGPNLKKVVTGYTYYKTLEPDPTFNQEIKMYLADENGTLFDASFKGSLTTIFGIPAGYLFFGLLAGLFGKYIFLFVYWVLPIFYIYLFRAIPGDFENRMKRLLIALILTILVLSIVTSINDEYFGNRTLAIFLSGLILLIGGTIISYKTEPVGDLMLL